MIMHVNELQQKAAAWALPWLKRGMICVQHADGKAFEVKGDELPENALAFGCGGWDESGRLHWVGIDLDVGHGGEKAYETTEAAIEAAMQLRNFVGGAAEIRLSKSGRGVHIRVAITPGIEDGRKCARFIAWWLAKVLDLRCDHSVLGRQNLWFWAKNTNGLSFNCIEECKGTWTPPPAALKEPEAQGVKILVVDRAPSTDQILKRAAAYMRKVEIAVSGNRGHDQAFKAACALVRGFNLSIADAKPIYVEWCNNCQPPWSEKEIDHKLSEAAKAGGERGYLLVDRPEFKTDREAAPTPKIKPSDLLRQQLQDEISGKRFAAEWPWYLLHRYTLALLPGTTTILCAPGGTAKSWFLLEALLFWRKKGYKVGVMELEEDLTFYLRRTLTQMTGESNITDPEWVKRNPEAALEFCERHGAELDALAECIYTPSRIDTKTVLKWLEHAVKAKFRIFAIDPITARDPSEKPWIDDHIFVRGAGEILKGSDTSLVLVTHPPKNAKDTSMDNIAGGAAFQKFTQVILWMECIQDEEFHIVTPTEDNWKIVNRKIHLRKTRSGKAQNTCIGYYFDPKTLRFVEQGILPRDPLEHLNKQKKVSIP